MVTIDNINGVILYVYKGVSIFNSRTGLFGDIFFW